MRGADIPHAECAVRVQSTLDETSQNASAPEP